MKSGPLSLATSFLSPRQQHYRNVTARNRTANADRDNRIIAFHDTPRYGRDERAAHRIGARPMRRRGANCGGIRRTGLHTTVHESVELAQDQCVTALRHVAGKSYPSPDRYGRAASCTCSRTEFCTSGDRARRTGEEDADVSVT